MLLNLIRKDFILVKKYVLFMAALCLLLPLFLLSRLPEFAGPLTYFISVVYSIFLLLQYVFLKEYQSPKASLLLCSSPYPRRLMVLGKYAFCLVLYTVCTLLYLLESLLLPGLGRFHGGMAVLVFSIITVFYGIYLPLQYRLGFEKTKFVTTIIIMACPFLAPFVLSKADMFKRLIQPLPPSLFYGMLLSVSFLMLIVSACLSVYFYEHTDLA
ncbi:MAG TPA: ABC-2 transporter permease [Candidatus Blautia ornithocaccae]|nr:ABC-2 transporter permease [Candidatus Blautia ornithocaccae]